MKLELTTLDRETTPLGELVLQRYDAPDGQSGYQVSIDGRFLMAAHGCSSERAMASVAHSRLTKSTQDLHVLVGGLGAGHTLRAALDLDDCAKVTVVEIGAKVVHWNRRYFAEFNDHAVDDPRVEVVVEDLADVIAICDARYDLMLLDVDNGPGFLAADGNAGLYSADGVRKCRDALSVGGVLAVWSPCRNPGFFATMRAVFDNAEEVDTTAIGREVREINDFIYLGW